MTDAELETLVARLREWCAGHGLPVDPFGRVCESDASDILGLDPATLRNDRATGAPVVPFIRIGGRRIRYDLRDLAVYLRGERIG